MASIANREFRSHESQQAPSTALSTKHERAPIPVVVLGDVHIDRIVITEPPDEPRNDTHQSRNPRWKSEPRVRRIFRYGGAWLIQQMLNAYNDQDNQENRPTAIHVNSSDEQPNHIFVSDGLKFPRYITASCYAKPTRAEHNRETERKEPVGSACLESVSKLARFPIEANSEAGEVVYRLKEISGWVVHDDEDSTRALNFLSTSVKELEGRTRSHQRDEKSSATSEMDTAEAPTAHDESQVNPFEIVVIYDRGDGFRDLDEDESLRRFIINDDEPHRPTIVWQRRYPFGDDNGNIDSLWELLADKKNQFVDSTIAVVKATCLRKAGVKININHSVEHFVEELGQQFDSPVMKRLLEFRHLVVWLEDGALHIDREMPYQIDVHYCPIAKHHCPFPQDETIEHENGLVTGTFSILTSAIVHGLAWKRYNRNDGDSQSDNFNGLSEGIRLGVVLAVRHYLRGYAPSSLYRTHPNPTATNEIDSVGRPLRTKKKKTATEFKTIPYPFRELFRKAWLEILELDGHGEEWKRKKDTREYMVSSLSFRTEPGTRLMSSASQWEKAQLSRVDAFLNDHKIDDQNASDPKAAIENKIREIVRIGFKQVVESERSYPLYTKGSDVGQPWFPEDEVHCPYMEAGLVRTVERNEIEAFITLHALMRSYCKNKRFDRPISIATFGAPGSGKSFGVKQLLKRIDEDAARDPLEFNVAQFTKIKDLAVAFHQAHDRIMSGVTPLLIFDEFDCSFQNNDLGWLKYFLAPMHDGVFRDEVNSYKVGRAIFLFCGGTKYTFKEFYEDRKDDDAFKSAKGPDFVSRLRGHLDVRDISVDDTDVSYTIMFHRAVLLRSLLEIRAPWVIDEATGRADIDDSVIDGFLRTPRFKHGIRSMEAIIDMSSTSSHRAFRKSSLPIRSQLEMHVSSKDFLSYVGDKSSTE